MSKRDPEKSGIGLDVNAQLQAVIREAYLESTETLKVYADKVRVFNEQKKAVREYLNALRKYRAMVMSAAREQGVSLCPGEKENQEILARLFEQNARVYEGKQVDYELCIPDRVPEKGVNSVAQLDDEIANWEGRLTTVADISELAGFDLQDAQQKQAQALQMMSNISKTMHDTAMAIIQNMRG